jgi:broad specificity phosphatase PhoE
MSGATQLFLLRHAEVETKYHRIFGGRIDMNISDRGHEQAAALAKYLKAKSFDAIYASPMKRVQQTLAPFAEGRTPAPVILEGLREVNFGDWTGLSWEQVKEKFDISAFEWLAQLDRAAIPNAESGAMFRARVEPCVEQILRAHAGQTVAVVCHGGTIRMILSVLLAMPFTQTSAFEIEYASVTQVRHAPNKSEIQLLNFTPWRDLS